MSLRKLLLVTYHFPPSAAVAVYRLLGFVRYLPRHGWDTVVVAPPSMPNEPLDPDLLREIPPSTAVLSVPLPDGCCGRLLRRWLPHATWLPRAWRACRRALAEHRPDAVLTSGPPHCVHWLGLRLQKKFGLPWLACFRDPWVTNRRKEDRASRWARCLERQVLERADGIIANTPLGLAGLRAAFPESAERLCFITNGFDPERFPPPQPGCQRQRLLLLHAGELYLGRDPRPLLDALRSLEETGQDPRFALHFLGRSTEGIYDLAEEVRRRQLEQIVTIGDQVPYRQSLQRMAEADVLLLIHSPGYRIGVPAKLYEYLGAGKPILALAEEDSDIAWVLQNSGLPYRLAPTGDASRIQQALRELGALASSTAPTVNCQSLQAFTREHMAAELARQLNRVCPEINQGSGHGH